jgi:catechol 2,3-dioxygenase-like lactoylglutathione lyase family enzyme
VAFKVGSLARARERLAESGARVQSSVTMGSGGREAVWSDPETTTGIPLQFVEESVSLDFKPSSTTAFIERIDHLGIAARSGDNARSVYVDGLGWPLESTQTDSEFLVPIEITSNDRYGARSHSGTPIPRVGSGLIALFVTVGDYDLEIMQPLGAAKISTPLGTIPGSVGQDQGAIAQALQKRGEGLLHIGFKVPDIREAIARVTKAGIDMIDPLPRPGSRNGFIAFMNRNFTERILLHFIERTPL